MAKALERVRSGIFKNATLIFIIALAIFVYIECPIFFTPTSLLNLSSQAAIFGMISIGMTFLMITGVADISVGSQCYLAGVVGVRLYVNTGNMALSMAGAIAVCLICSSINGVVIARFGLPDMISTMAMQFIARGAANLIVGQESVINVSDPVFQQLGQGKVGGLPISVIFLFGMLIIGYIVLHHTKFGRYTYAIGNSKDALASMGVNVFLMRMIGFWITGALCGFAGFVNVSRLGGATFGMSTGMEFTCISICAVGGVSLRGGKGSMLGTLMGTAVIASIYQLLRLMGVSSYLYDLVWGIVVLSTIAMDYLKSYQIKYERIRRNARTVQQEVAEK